MKYDVILVRYGELSLKAPYVRNSFESKLVANIRNALAFHNITSTINRDRGRMYVRTAAISQSLNILSRTFGVTSFSPALETEANLDCIGVVAQNIASNNLSKDTSFALRVTRTGNHPFSSQDVAIRIGDVLQRKTHATVNLNVPDVTIFIEIRNDNAYLFFEKIKGVSGMPLGTQGTVLAVIDDAYSLLAAWYLMHRGCNLLIFTAKETTLEEVTSFLNYWFQEPHVIIGRSLDCQGFEEIRSILTKHKCYAIVTGHALQEEPARALQEIAFLKSQLPVPVLTPLISMETKTIRKKCTEVGISL